MSFVLDRQICLGILIEFSQWSLPSDLVIEHLVMLKRRCSCEEVAYSSSFLQSGLIPFVVMHGSISTVSKNHGLVAEFYKQTLGYQWYPYDFPNSNRSVRN